MAKVKTTNRSIYRVLPKRRNDSPDNQAAIRPRGPRNELASEHSVSTYSTDSISEDEDDVNSEAIVGRPTKDEQRKWKDDEHNHPYAKFISSRSGFGDDSWVGRQPLGAGSFGIAGLWERVTISGRVIDQMVVKQVGSGKWKKDMPREATIMRKLNEADCNSLVRYRGHRRYPRYRVHRIYMEYCPYGDLKKLVDRYRRFGHYFPEPFLWETFHYLVEAAAAMRDGPKDCKVEEQWDKEIVHCDLKPANGYEDTASGVPFYPTAKFGDFGLSFETDTDDPLNPWKYRGWGTLDYQAPEQLNIRPHTLVKEYNPVQSKRKIPKKILAHTNVWAIGAIMFKMLTLERITHCLNKGHKGVKDDEYKRMMKKPKNGRLVKYSRELRDLIRDCLHAKPEERVTIDLLQVNVKRYRDVVSKKYNFQGKSRSTPNQQDRVYYNRDEINELGAGTFKPLRRLEPPEEEESGPKNDSVRIKFPPRPDLNHKIPRDSFQKDNFGDDTEDEVDGPEGAIEMDQDDKGDGNLPSRANLNGQQLFDGMTPRSPARKRFIPPGGRAPRGPPTSVGRRLNNPIIVSENSEVEGGLEGGLEGEGNDKEEEGEEEDEGNGRQHSEGWKGPKVAAPPAGKPEAENGREGGKEDDNEEDEDEYESDSITDTESEHDTTTDESDSEESDEDDQNRTDSDGDDSSAGNPDTEDSAGSDSDEEANDSKDQHSNPNPLQAPPHSRPKPSKPTPPSNPIQPPQQANLMYLARATGSAMKRLFGTSNSQETSHDPSKETSNKHNDSYNQRAETEATDEDVNAPERPTGTSSNPAVIHTSNSPNKRKRNTNPAVAVQAPSTDQRDSNSKPTPPHPTDSSEGVIHDGNYRLKRKRLI